MATTNSYIKGISNITLRSLNPGSNGQIVMLPTATGLVYSPNYEDRPIDLQTDSGVAALAQVVETRVAPTYEVSLPTTAIAMAIAAFGFEWTDTTNEVIQFLRTIRPRATTALAAVVTGQEGFGIAEDATAICAYQDPTDITSSIQLTQDTYTGFDPAATDDSFVIGANRELIISQNVIDLNPVVTIMIEQTLASARKIGAQAFDTFEMNAAIITVGGQKVYLKEGSVKVLPSSRAFDSTAESLTITLSALQDGSNATPLPQIVDKGNAQLAA